MGMDLLEKYESARGDIFKIYVDSELAPRGGDYEGLFFKVEPGQGDNDSWNCHIKVSGTLLEGIWELTDRASIYKILKDLGAIKIKIFIETKDFRDSFSFISDNSEKEIENEQQRIMENLNTLRSQNLRRAE